MKTILRLALMSTVLLFPSARATAEGARLTFHAPFDKGTLAEKAEGAPEGAPSAKTALMDGVVGKAVVVGVAQGSEMSCKYDGRANISAESGTVSFWLRPLDWDGKDAHFQIFFSARGENSVMHIYRYLDVGARSPHSRKLLFLFGPAHKNREGAWEWTIASSPRARKWKAKEWRHVACTWDAETMRLYLDGRIEDERRVKTPPATGFDEFAVGGFGSWKNAGGRSLIDELKIYSAPLSSAEIYTEWEANRPRRGQGAPAKKEASFKLDYVYTNIRAGTLNLGLRQPYPLWAGKPVTARVRLLDKRGTTALERSFSEAEYSYEVTLDISRLPPGDYTVATSFVGNDGTALASLRDDYRKYPPAPPPWEGNKIGITDRVPQTWTAVEVSGGSVKCWGREYRFGDSPFPRQIVSQGEELLRLPIRMSCVVNGAAAVLRGRGMTWEQTSGAVAKFRGQGVLGTLRARYTGRVEYDGFVWMSIVLESPSPVEVSKLVVEMPFRKDAASLRNLGDYRLKKTGEAPPTGAYFKNLEERPIFWLGNEEAGVQWFAENLKNWRVEDAARALEVVADERTVLARLNIVDTATRFDGRRDISFGLQATPVRPKPRAWRTWRLRPWRTPRPAYNIRPWFTKWTELFNYPELSRVDKKKIAELRRYKRDGMRVLNYLSLTCTTPYSPEFKYYGERWRKTPEERVLVDSALDPQTRIWAHYTICANEPSYRDFYLWLLRRAVHDLELTGGLYFDQAAPRMCSNELHGCLWRDAKGRSHKTFNILGARELAKRIYVMMKDYSPDAIIAHHMSGEVTMPVNAFSDLMIDGENLTGAVGLAGSYYNALSLGKFRAEYMPHQWGTIPAILPQLARSASILKTSEETYWYTSREAEKPINHLLGLVVVHDAMIWPAWEVRPNKLWRARDEFGWDEKVTFLPYWDNAEYLRVFSPKSKNVVVSLFKRPGRIMLVPFNNTDADILLKIELASARLGLPKGQELRLRDAYHGGVFTARDGVAEIPTPGRGFRMLIASVPSTKAEGD